MGSRIALPNFPESLKGLMAGRRGISPRPQLEEFWSHMCDDAAGFEASWNATASNDADHCRCAGSTKQSVKMTADGDSANPTIQDNFGVVDMDNTSEHHLYVRFYIHEGSGLSSWEGINYIQITFYDHMNRKFEWRIYNKEANNESMHPGWHELSASETIKYNEDAGFTWATVDQIRIAMNTSAADKTCAVTWDRIAIVKPMSQAIYCLTYDDGWADFFTIAQYLEQYKLPATFYVHPTAVDSGANYLTTTQCQEMVAMGHLIANHTWDNYTWNDLSDQQKIDAIMRTQEWMYERGLGAGARIQSIPHSGWAAADHSLILGGYIDQVRLKYRSSGYLPSTYAQPSLPFDRTFHPMGALNDYVVAGTLLDRVIAEGALGIFDGHYFMAGNLSETAFETFVSGAGGLAEKRDAGDVVVVTMDQLLTMDFGATQLSSARRPQKRKTYAQVSTAVAAAEIKVVHIAKAAGRVVGFSAGDVTANQGGATVTFDLKKNGATILTSTVQLADTHANYEVVSGSIATAPYIAGDVFEVAVAVNAGGGTLGNGAFAQMDVDENSY